MTDDHDVKGAEALLNLSPLAVGGLSVGVTFFADRIPPEPDLVTRRKTIGARMAS